MKFEILRASKFGKPCEEAIAEICVDEDTDYNFWSLELKTLEELLDFREKYDKLVISYNDVIELNTITIYDDLID